ncbi:hypothetical protein CYY_002291 [Polysphondylium violaceum]|uniref:DEX1 C-terminal domain-containing protein n=1 Tax=Polysphondylium violaceum TaxID=133409 RepID=A0A8J4PYM8_9MYCE|nr:hypothetical protein CYY_002291 [Polysphondylium violaceum]
MNINNRILLLCIVLVLSGTLTVIDCYQAADENQLAIIDNKFRNKDPLVLEEVIFGKDISKNSSIYHNNKSKSKRKREQQQQQSCTTTPPLFDIEWESQTSALVSSTPVISELFSDGIKYIVVANSYSYIDVISAHDGERALGWPFILPASGFTASPLVYDFNQDDRLDVIVTTNEGEIVFIDRSGIAIFNSTLRVPPLKVKKDWYTNLDLNHVDAALSLHNKENQRNAIKRNLDQQFRDQQEIRNNDTYTGPPTAENRDQVLEDIQMGMDKNDPLYSQKFDDYLLENLWYSVKDPRYVWIDPHVLSTPVIADIDNDGIMEMIVSVSYYFDQELYSNPLYRSRLDPELLLDRYVAGGIVCFNLETGEIKWQTHLDLTTDKLDTLKGYLYNSPTVVDLDRDRMMEIIVGTGLGFVYVLDHQGNPREGQFPLIMEPIFSQIVTEDVNNDGQLEIIVSGTGGNIVCFSNLGIEMWENMVSGMNESPVSIGDINGDGNLDVVVGTFSGGIWAFTGSTGKSLDNFPIKLSSPIVTQLQLIGSGDSMNILVHASDGILYSINGKDTCVTTLDIGETSLSTILINDLTGNGYMDLLITGYSKKMFCIGTNIPYSPTKVVNSFNRDRNVFTSYPSTSSKDSVGIYILPQYRAIHDISGSELVLEFEILGRHDQNRTVALYYGSRVLSKTFFPYPGAQHVTIELPHTLSRSDLNTLKLVMITGNGQYYSDSITVSINYYFYRLLKWIVLLPILLSTFLIFIETSRKSGINIAKKSIKNSNTSNIYSKNKL